MANLHLGEQVFLAEVTLALGNVHPNGSGEVLTNQLQLRPVLATLGVTLVGRRGSERDGETDNETKHGEQQVADLELVNKLGDAGDERRPQGYDGQWKDHLGKHGTVHAQEEGPLGMFGHVARANLGQLASDSRADMQTTYKVVPCV